MARKVPDLSEEKKDKIEFLKKLNEDYKVLYSEDKMKVKINELESRIMNANFDKKECFVPKTNLSYREYMAIKNDFN